MHIQLDPVGGIAGDMFAAAVLDAWPELEPDLAGALARSGLDAIATVERVDHADHALTGSRFEVREADSTARESSCRRGGHSHDDGADSGADGGTDGESGHEHHLYRDIRTLLRDSELDPGVRSRALDIFARLARAESVVHGVPIDDVSFHEVGAYDSIADVVCAGWLIDRLDATWSCGPLPIGRGRVDSAHGRLPVPAPATVELLRGMIVDQDTLHGERITPTGAAIVSHLEPSFEPIPGAMRLDRSGVGFGTSRLPGTSNVLRLLAFRPSDELGFPVHRERIGVVEFEVDDQTGEDLALALDRLRDLDGVLDVSSHGVNGKKGRLAVHVRLLARIATMDSVIESSFRETTTLGVRWREMNRATLPRESATVMVDGRSVRVKSARRPGPARTTKAEIDDLAPMSGGHADRERLRTMAERAGDAGSS